MACILPFRAVRYAENLRKKMPQVLAPPYDVISRDMKRVLLRSHPSNAIRLIVGNPSVETHHDSDFAKAGKTFQAWRRRGVLERDPQPTLTVYRQVFKVEGKTYRRTGFLALSRLEPFGRAQGGILAHEFTLAGPKADRLRLMKSARANFSPIFSLYPDGGGVGKVLSRVTDEKPDVTAAYPKDVQNHLWRVTAPDVLNAIQERIADSTLFIADGHHRYETALAYQAWCRKGDRTAPGSRPCDWVMMMFVAMEDPGLVILPTHRCLAPGKIADTKAFLASMAKIGKVTTVPGGLSGSKPVAGLERAGRKGPVLGLSFDGRTLHLIAVSKAAAASKALEGLSKAQRGLDVTLLHRLILEPMLGITKERAEHDLVFTAKAEEGVKRLRTGASGAVFFLNPTRIQQLRDVAGAGERMPQKSTFFYPKLVTGIAFNDLSEF
jgi:uncharacterized protein (DUF1015 family)